MSANAATDLRSLKEHPFELLREIERRSMKAIAGAVGDDIDVEEWVGVGFRLGVDKLVIERTSVREVLMVPTAITRVPGAKSWIRGLANIRGHLLPVVDLRNYFGGGLGGQGRSSRVLVMSNPAFPVGLVVDEVYGFRRFLDSEHTPDVPDLMVRCDRYTHGTYRRGEEVWPVLGVETLFDSAEFRRAAED